MPAIVWSTASIVRRYSAWMMPWRRRPSSLGFTLAEYHSAVAKQARLNEEAEILIAQFGDGHEPKKGTASVPAAEPSRLEPGAAVHRRRLGKFA